MNPVKHDNPPAFPFATPYPPDERGMTYGVTGMSLRDWFAGKALQGYLAGRCWEDHSTDYENVWSEAYKLADYMLAQRGKE